ncbi:hypothetical protein Ddc_21928 [Ditylenchus destructor]|nr:hypothetical protein Ddc_21928 [Ditylenchus destructor]
MQSFFPTFLFSGSRPIKNDPLETLFSGKGINRNRRNDDDESYTVFNGPNRMQVEFVRGSEKQLNARSQKRRWRVRA